MLVKLALQLLTLVIKDQSYEINNPAAAPPPYPHPQPVSWKDSEGCYPLQVVLGPLSLSESIPFSRLN